MCGNLCTNRDCSGRCFSQLLEMEISILYGTCQYLCTQHIDQRWESFWPDPPFPAFPSGHAIQAAAAATVLTDLYGDNFSLPIVHMWADQGMKSGIQILKHDILILSGRLRKKLRCRDFMAASIFLRIMQEDWRKEK